MYVLLCIVVFLVSFVGSAVFKMKYKPLKMRKYTVKWTKEIGTVYTDIPYGEGEANKFDLYVPADSTKETYSLVVYLHPGGFTTGDKKGDAEILQWLCSKGYVAAGINYTLRTDEHPEANVYSQSMEIKNSIPVVVKEAEKLGYKLDAMAVAGGSAGCTLAMLYGYRDAAESPIPVKMLFGAVGPSSFYPEDWGCFGLDKNPEAAAALFGVMSGKELSADMFGTEAYEEIIKDISAYMWIDENSVPSVVAYGAHDKMQSFAASKHLADALKKYNVPHEYIVCPHSGHGLQNDTALSAKYMEKAEEYLDTYLPVK